MRRVLIIVAVVGLVAAACSGDDSGTEEAAGDDQVADQDQGDPADETSPTTLQNGRSTAVDDRRSESAGGEQRPRVVAQDNRFIVENIQVDAGARVRWRNEGQNEHNLVVAREGVEAVDAEANAFGVLQAEFQPGDTYNFTFDEPGVYEYYCSLHGTPDQGMVGAVIVGDEEYVPEIPVIEVEKVEGTLQVPADYDTIQAAVDAAAQGAMVLIDEGVYEEAVVVNSPNIVIRGMDRNTTILDGGDSFANGFHIFADGVAVENMTARNFTVNGFFWDGVTGYRGSYITAHNVKAYGIYAFGSVSGQFDHSYASGSDDGGFYIGQCSPCDAVITDVYAENNQLGYSGTNASDVIIVNSIWTRNRIGIVPNSQDVEDLAPVRDNVFVGNVVVNNNNLDAPSNNDLYDLMNHVGIAMAGTIDSTAARNLVLDHEWFGIATFPFPRDEDFTDFYFAERNEIRDNVVMNSTKGDLVLLLGEDAQLNCFEGNEFETSVPPGIEVIQPCDGPRTGEGIAADALVVEVLAREEPDGLDYTEMPPAPPQDNMPGDPETEPAIPATTDVVPLDVDIDAIGVPELPEDLVSATSG